MISLGRVPWPGNAACRNGRWRLLLIGGLALTLVAAALFLKRQEHRLGPISALRPVSATILPGVSVIAELGPSVAYAIETSEGLVLVDSGLDGDAAPLKAQMSRLGLDWKRIRAVLLTHAHGDHSGGAAHLRTAAGARIHAGRGDAAVLRAGEPRVAFFSAFYFPEHTPHPTTVDVDLEGGETLAFGDVRIHVLATPGHTPGSTCYLMERNGLRILFSGDVISSLLGEPTRHSQERNPLGTYSAYLAPRYRGDAAAYLDSLQSLRALTVPDLVLPGHPASDSSPQSPQLSQKRWETMLDQGIREMTRLVAHYQADGADFLDDRPKELLPGLDYLGDFHGKAVYGLVSANRFFVITSTGAPGLGDFLREGRKQLGLEPQEPTAVLLTSCAPEETAGLKDLTENAHAEIIGPEDGLRALKEALPAGAVVAPSGELARKNWFAVTTTPLPGRGIPAVAYQVPWAGKTVLFTDRIPLLFNHESGAALSADLVESRTNTLDFMLSIERLAELKPDLWLPAEAVEGQNANIYDREWKFVVDSNLLAGFNRLGKQR